MTDEEMAEEYAEEKVSNLDECRTKDLMRSVCKDGFLAGLKAGRPQWHDLRKQIPTENKMYLVSIKGNGLAIAYFNGKHWETKYNLGDFGHCVETVIAWCEIPTFDKE